MWINEEVDVLARHVSGVRHPFVRAIRWQNRRIDMQGSGHVERKAIGLDYECTDGTDRYFLHFHPRYGRWVLLWIDDSGLRSADASPSPPARRAIESSGAARRLPEPVARPTLGPIHRRKGSHE